MLIKFAHAKELIAIDCVISLQSVNIILQLIGSTAKQHLI